jgi:hypothetical protein
MIQKKYLFIVFIGAFKRPLRNNSNEYDKEKIIAQFDVLYRVLIKLGFQTEDVSSSFEATLSKSIEDHLDWVKKDTSKL